MKVLKVMKEKSLLTTSYHFCLFYQPKQKLYSKYVVRKIAINFRAFNQKCLSQPKTSPTHKLCYKKIAHRSNNIQWLFFGVFNFTVRILVLTHTMCTQWLIFDSFRQKSMGHLCLLWLHLQMYLWFSQNTTKKIVNWIYKN